MGRGEYNTEEERSRSRKKKEIRGTVCISTLYVFSSAIMYQHHHMDIYSYTISILLNAFTNLLFIENELQISFTYFYRLWSYNYVHKLVYTLWCAALEIPLDFLFYITFPSYFNIKDMYQLSVLMCIIIYIYRRYG